MRADWRGLRPMGKWSVTGRYRTRSFSTGINHNPIDGQLGLERG